MLNIIPILAFKDNYIWLLVNPDNQSCVIVDPGDADPVIHYVAEHNLKPIAILITHHHHDHTGGIEKLRQHYPHLRLYGPNNEQFGANAELLKENDTVNLPELNLSLKVLDIPGHTLGHIAYVGDNKLFCGDTLFSAGCGRVFEGTHEQMYDSLMKLKSLPDATAVFPGHEYTEANLKFAQAADETNQQISQRIKQVQQIRSQNKPSLPSTILIEKQTNPFLRCEEKTVIHSLQSKINLTKTDPVSVFTALREWKNNF